MWRLEPITFHIGELTLKLILALIWHSLPEVGTKKLDLGQHKSTRSSQMTYNSHILIVDITSSCASFSFQRDNLSLQICCNLFWLVFTTWVYSITSNQIQLEEGISSGIVVRDYFVALNPNIRFQSNRRVCRLIDECRILLFWCQRFEEQAIELLRIVPHWKMWTLHHSSTRKR